MGDVPQFEVNSDEFEQMVKQAGVKDDPKISGQDQISELKTEISNLKSIVQDKQPPGSYQNVRSDRDQLVDRYAKAINWIVEKGGNYDPTTGQIVEPAKDTAPDYTAQIKDLDSQLATVKKNLKSQFSDGELTQEEYLDKLDTETGKFRDQKYDLVYDQKTANSKQEQQKEQQAQNQTTNLKNQFESLRSQYPDADNQSSDLYKAMCDVLAEDNTIDINQINYGDVDSSGNVIEYKGNPQARKLLIERAQFRLERQGKTRANQHNQSAQQTSGLTPTDYQDRAQPEKGMNKEQLGWLVAEGVKNKVLLKDINKTLSAYNETGILEIEG